MQNAANRSSLNRHLRGPRPPARPSNLLMTLVRRARALWLGWLEARWAELKRWHAQRKDRQAVRRAAAVRPDRPMIESLEPKLLLSADLMPMGPAAPEAVHRSIDLPTAHIAAAGAAAAAASQPQASTPSELPTLVITGPGSGQFVADGSGFQLQLKGTTLATTVSATIPGGGRLALSGLSADGAVGTLNLANADLSGNAAFAASVAKLTLGQLSHARVSVAGAEDFVFNATSVGDSQLSALLSNISVTVTDWTSSAPGAGRIEAAGLKTLSATGNVASDLFLGGVSSGYALGTVQLGGAIAGGLWSVHGRANSITAQSTAPAWRLNVSGTLAQLVTKGDASGDLAVGGLQMLQIGGSARGLHLLVGADLGDDAALGGIGANGDRFQPGTLARVRITGDLVDSSLLVSVDPVNGAVLDGDDKQIGTVIQRIQELIIGGRIQGNSAIAAPSFPTLVKVGGVSVTPASLPAMVTAPRDTTLPVLSVRLFNDAGSSALDGLTNDPRLVATVSDAGGAASLQGRLAGGTFSALAVTQLPEGRQLVGADELARLNGGSLPDGNYSFELRAIDLAGNLSSTASVTMMLRTVAPTLATIGLDAASDNAPLGDMSTASSIVRLIGMAQAGVAISLRRVNEQAELATTIAAADGSFSFEGVNLAAPGANGFSLTLVDGAGNTRSQSFSINFEGSDTTAPTLTAALQSDTGRSAADRITSEPAISGKVTDNQAVGKLFAVVDPGATPTLVDVSSALQPDGSFVLSASQLATLAGGVLSDGAHTVRLQAKDGAGNASATVDVSFTLDRQAPSGASFGISSVDALGGYDAQTAASIALLQGSAEPGATITLAAQGLSTTASGTGGFQLPGVAFASGDNLITLTIFDTAGNSQTVSRTLTRVAQAPSDAVLDWTLTALKAIQLDVTHPHVATRTLAIQSIAVYDSLAAIQRTPAYMVQRTVSGAADAQAAAAQAAYRVLYMTYPGQRSILDAALAASLAKVPDGAAKTAGIALGDSVAQAVWAIRADDGYRDFAIDDGGSALGQWRSTGPMYLVPEEPQWGSVTPFALRAGDEFRAVAPPTLDSAEYAAAINQVQSLGGVTSTARTADQTQQAQFWADGQGSYTPPGHWAQIAAQVAAAQGNSLSANARLMAQLNVALADAAIAAWDTKYTYDFWRPVTAIQNADKDGNAATTLDASWTSLLITPAHPSYVSGHSTFSAAAAGILDATFGANTSFSTTASTLPGITRSFASFDQAAEEASMSRIYGGIHTMLDTGQGKRIGSLVAQAVLARFALANDTQAPGVVMADSPADAKANLTFTGQVLDNLSGVASAQYRIDGGALQPLSFDASGKFSVTTALALDGSQDGPHSVTVVAVDAAGNASSEYVRSFSLDTKAPVIGLASVAAGDALSAATRLTGAANPTGPKLVQLSYQLDAGKTHKLVFDSSTGGFDQALELGNLNVGEHTLSITARDAAGNVTTLSRAVKLDSLAAFNVTKVTPADGSADVGVTFRPQVFFNRAVNPSTLTADTFYATGPDGSKLATTIVPALDGSFAWLFFTNPMPGGSNVTLHLLGSAIRAASDGSFLDADGNGTAGGDEAWSFTTVSTTTVLGAKLTGKVVDPGPDLLPMTFDDIRRGPDGVIHTADDVFLNPIANAKVFILGRPDLVTYTDAQGNFSFDSVPVGNVKVGVDGRTASNPPTGVFWPEMVMDVTLRPGITNTLMGSMGTTASQQENADRKEVYIPRVQTAALQAVSDTMPTKITIDEKSAPDLTDEQRTQLTLTVAPGSSVGSDGKVLENVQIGINTVPAELVKDMLPPGVMQHTFDITIQAPGVDTFTQPVLITFPNVFNAAPGTKLNVLSFDHTTGRLVINGTATVSADGKTVVSDEGAGVTAPGWHGLTPPGSEETVDPDATSPPVDSDGDGIPDVQDDDDDNDGVDDKDDDDSEYLVSVGWGAVVNFYGKYSYSFGLDLPVKIFEEIGGIVDTTKIKDIIQKNVIKGEGTVPEKPTDFPIGPAPATFTVSKWVGDHLIPEVDMKLFGVEFGADISAGLGLSGEFHLNGYSPTTPGGNSQKLYLDSLDFKPGNVDLTFYGQIQSTFLSHIPFGIGNFLTKKYSTPAITLLGLPTVDLLKLYPGVASFTIPGVSAIDYRDSFSVGAFASAGLAIKISPQIYIHKTLVQKSNNLFPEFGTAALFGSASGDTNAGDAEVEGIPISNSLSLIDKGDTYYFYELADGTSFRGNVKFGQSITQFMPANTEYKLSLFDLASNRTKTVIGATGASGSAGHTSVPLTSIGGTDYDGDGISDAGEYVLGTNSENDDSDRDGIKDLTELQQGLDPLGGQSLPLGVVSSSGLQGSSEAVASASLIDGAGGTSAVVATGPYGLALVDVTQSVKPQVRAELDLPGFSSDVAVDSGRALAMVASGDAGLHIVDISNSTAPKLRQTVNFNNPATRVAVSDGSAFVTVGASVANVDLNSGEVRQLLNLGNANLTDIAIDGNTVYTMDTSKVLRSLRIDGDVLTLLDSLTLNNGGGKLFVGGGVAYLGTTTTFAQGFLSVDVSDSANLLLLSGVDATNVAGQAMAANGSGLLVTVGQLAGPQGQAVYALDVNSVSDPSDTGKFLTRVNLPAAPKDIVIANGLALVADGSGGLQVVNYIGFDSKGIAPVVTIQVDAVDADPNTAGVQVLEGRTLRVIPTVTDDVQVRSVELLVNGQVVSNDVSFPFELFTQTPTIAQGGSTVTVQVRATDTGGNVTLSAPAVLPVVPDTFAPVLQSASVEEGARRFFVKSIDLKFDEPLDLAKLNAAGVALVRVGADGNFGTADDVAVPVTLDTRSQGQIVSILPGGYLAPGDYQLTVSPGILADAAGNGYASAIVRHFTIRPASDVKATSGVAEIPTAPSANPGQQIGIAVPFDPATAKAQFQTIDTSGNKSVVTVSVSRWDTVIGTAYFNVPANALTGDVTVYSLVGSTRTDFADGTFPLQIVPVILGVEVQSVASDGSSAVVVLRGSGFIEGNNSEYRFGSGADAAVIVDAGASVGPDVYQQFYDPAIGYYFGVQVTVPLSAGVFGGITVKTAGGVSASFSTSLTSVQSSAYSGTPANAAQASANAGQAITLNGAGLSTSTDVLLRYTDYQGVVRMVQLNPIAAAADGKQATLVVPIYANGAFSLQIFGSAAQPLLQIVPTVQSYDANGNLFGSGFVEGATQYSFPGYSVNDNAISAGVDVYSGNNDRATVTAALLPRFGLGAVSVTTAGGSAAATPVNMLRPGSDVAASGALADLAVDPVSGALWAVDSANPGHLLRIDAATGQVLQTLTMTAGAYGVANTGNYAGLQILAQAMTLGSTVVPAGSALLFTGTPNPDRVVAVNLSTGNVIATLSTQANYDLVGGVYDATSGHLFLLSHQLNQMVEVNAGTGAEFGRFELPLNIQSWSGITRDPVDGNLWIGSYNGVGQLVKINRAGVELARVNLAPLGVDSNEISGLAFAADGTLRVASTQGVIYRVALGDTDAAIAPATLGQVIGSALSGTAAQGNVAAANVGQVIELVGSHFGAGTQVLFNVRDNAGNTGVQAVAPLLINAAGTRLQVIVPDKATSGDIRVSNVASQDLGFNGSYTDALHRQVTASFTASGTTAQIRFSDGGLEALSNESWGLDNVLVKQGASTVFQDNFEGGAKANWSNTTTNKEARASFSEFSGRFNNASQNLNLTGLTAGLVYTLSFDLYAIDSWEGNAGNPDQISVAVDGATVLSKTVSNYVQYAQTLNASAGVRLQVVPTLSAMSSGPGGDAAINLSGSGFMEGATSVTVGGVVQADTNNTTSPFDVTGARNDTLNVVLPRTLDGPLRVTTEGGYAELAAPDWGVQPLSQFSGITSSANAGQAGNPNLPSASTGQAIVLTGQALTSSTLVQFQGIDDSGRLGTLTRTGTAGNNGTTLSIEVPALARTGLVTVLGSSTSIPLQIVPTLRAVGGSLAVGNTLVLEGTGLTGNDLAIQIDGQGVGNFTLRTLNDGPGSSYLDQQLLTLTVPAGISAGVITVSTAGGTSVLRMGAVNVTTLADQTPAADVGDTLLAALNIGLGVNQSLKITGSVSSQLDVDLHRIELNAGDQLSFFLSNNQPNHVRMFDATGKELMSEYRWVNDTALMRLTAPAAGSYYIGISGYYNLGYNPQVANSGSNGSYTGAYTLNLERLAAGSSHIASITAEATSGTPAVAGVASANTGQTLTLNGLGLLDTDRVVFTTLDDSGRLTETVVDALTVSGDGSSLTVVVPQTATTARVRLQRDNGGILLQIVPTLSDVSGNNGSVFHGGPLTLTGTGFAEGTSTALFGNQRVDDAGRNYGMDIHNSGRSLNLTVPEGVATGPIRVNTVGGTSAAFGLSLSGIVTSAASGSAVNGAQASANPGQLITLNGAGFDTSLDVVFETIDSGGNRNEVIVRPTIVSADGTQAQMVVPATAITGVVRVVGDIDGRSIPLQIVPVILGVEVQSVASDGSSAVVVLRGSGFIEGNNSEYRFGSGADAAVIVDAGASVGPDVYQQFYDPAIGYYFGVQVTVPLSAGVFGGITVKTAGGVSASFSTSLTSVQSSAYSGTPANAAQASANAGQAITLNGAGLSTSTDVLLRYTDYQGVVRMVQLNPIAAAADGKQATLVVPIYANGAFSLQIFGSAAQPLLQIVPTVQSYDANGNLFGSGFVEGATQYSFPGYSVNDNAISAGVDVYSGNNDRATVTAALLPRFGLGAVSVTTAGGSAAATPVNMLRPGSDVAASGALADLAVDPVSGALWAVDSANPGHLLRIDAATGQVLQTLTMTAGAYGVANTGNYAGLQILAQAMTLGSTVVPAGSALLFTGTPNPDRVVAVNLSTGNVIATLSTQANYDLVGGVYDATSGHLFLLSHQLNQMVEVNAGTGAEFGRFELPLNIQSWSGITRDPVDGNLWIGSYNGVGQLVKINRAGVELARVNLAPLGVDSNEISGLAFAADGTLRVASTQGVIYRVALGDTDAAIAPATLGQVIGSALSGTAAQGNVAAANVGQVIELVGSHFGAGTQVLFNVRDNAGNTGVQAVAPLLINAAGTRLQVIVPDKATSGDIRVSNVASQDLGFNGSYTDALHRQVTASFTASGTTAQIRFSDGGLEALSNESWGLDNVLVKQGASTVFQDNFEGGAKANWSNTTTNKEARASFSEFSGRFNNASQNLNLTGLTAGLVYTLSFDLYAIDSWEGNAGNPDQISVAVDGATVLSKTVSNYVQYAQTLNASAGVRLQVVPTLSAMSSGPGGDAAINLSGSGFMEGATSVTVGGVVQADTNNTTSPFDVTGARNDTLNVVLPRTLDGPLRVTTEGGYAELAAPDWGVQPLSQFSGITSSANAGQAGNPNLPSASTGQAIVLTGQALTSSTLVQFQGIDDSGRLGTLTRTGTAGNNGTTLSIEVPALARTGLVTVLGSSTSIPLQIVPTLRAVGGSLAVGNTLVLEGTGLTGNDLAIQIDGQGVGNFTLRTLNDGPGSSYLDQQLLTLTVPAGISAGVITVSTAGGTSVLRMGAVNVTTLADQTPAADVGDTLLAALNIGLGVNQSLKITGSVSSQLDVDLHRIELNAGDQLSFFLSNNQPNHVRMFDATGKELMSEYRWVNDTALMRLTAPAAGSYYIGISGYYNLGYNPQVANSGSNGSYTGAYTLNLERLAAGSSHIASITAEATSGTPAVAGVASANTGQTLTLNGLGLLDTDRVVFTTLDDSGRLTETVVDATAIAADGKSLTVVVPLTATTSRVRLERDNAGILLQVVPRVTAITANGATSFTLTGSGFAEGAVRISVGAVEWSDPGRYYDIDVYNQNSAMGVSNPAGLSRSTVQVITSGGTSAVVTTGLP